MNRSTGITTIAVDGPVLPKEIIDVLNDVWARPDYSGRALWDFRRADLATLTPTDLLTLSQFVENNQPAGLEVRVALVVRSPEDFAVGRMSQSYMEPLTRGFHVCFSIEEAEEWLGDR